jgi:hypothetical protein
VPQFKLSTDPQFAAELHEIVGLYVDLPDHAIVLSIGEKRQIQVLDRTQPDLPMKNRPVPEPTTPTRSPPPSNGALNVGFDPLSWKAKASLGFEGGAVAQQRNSPIDTDASVTIAVS